ncbi:alpha/beta hydrolase [Nocardia sp. NPDC057030]|uniref:alpha/beta hydrolase n=1 Tax=unclassified Nocardia TaxID=2637762 RepID=UPI00363E853F
MRLASNKAQAPRHGGPLARLVATVFLLAATIFAGACAAEPAREPADPVDAVQWERLIWQPCGEQGAECATLRVPLDWGVPEGERITLALARQPARRAEQRVGSVFFNPGGPGGPAVLMVRDYPDRFRDELRDRFDLIGLDPRGVGESRPAITCPIAPTSPTVRVFPSSAAEFDALAAYNRAVGAECLRATGPLLEHVDSISAARDLEAARRALGGDKLNWLGLSYGTLLGATYAHLYPGNIRAAVLDGPVDHAISAGQFFLDETRSAEDSFAGFLDWCRADPGCALHDRDAATDYRGLLDRAERQPVPARDNPEGLTASQIGTGAYGLLSWRRTWPQLAEAIAAAVSNTPDASGFAEPGGADAGAAAYRTIMCHDFPADVRDFTDLAARIDTARRAAPLTRAHVEGADVQGGCIGWPVTAANPPSPVEVRGAPPIMIVAGTHDPATPLPWGEALARRIQGSFLVTWDGYGHTAYLNDVETTRREIEYLIDPPAPR